jgi:hypothetical protein
MREKILRALNASDLSIEEWESAAHVIASLGAAQINRKHLSLGSYLLHIRAGHTNFIPRVLGLLGLTIASRARRNGWKGVGRHNASLVAQIALQTFLDSTCKACSGVGKLGEYGQVFYICQSCKGNGKKRDDDRSDAEFIGMSVKLFRANEMRERLKDVISFLDRAEGLAAGGTRGQARG